MNEHSHKMKVFIFFNRTVRLLLGVSLADAVFHVYSSDPFAVSCMLLQPVAVSLGGQTAQVFLLARRTICISMWAALNQWRAGRGVAPLTLKGWPQVTSNGVPLFGLLLWLFPLPCSPTDFSYVRTFLNKSHSHKSSSHYLLCRNPI